MPAADVIIVGGGLVGLAAARRLALDGLRVTLFERGRAGGESSGAAAGMLLAQGETDPPRTPTPRFEEFFRILLVARDLYPAFLHDVSAESGVTLSIRREAIALALDAEESAHLSQRIAWQVSRGLRAMPLPLGELERRAPGVRAVSAALFPDDGFVDVGEVIGAAAQAAVKAGVTLREETPVTGLLIQEDTVVGVSAGGEFVEAGAVVLAAGAWTESLLPHEEPRWNLRPARGVLVTVRPPAPITLPLMTAGDRYLVPRTANELLAGTTLEDVGFDREVSPATIERILAGVAQFLPAVAEWKIQRAWPGFRPRSGDDFPVIGPAQHRNLWIATGHYRNGILLAPLTAAWISEGIRTGSVPDEAKVYAPSRRMGILGAGR
jgi:glycine oxidase